MYNNDIVIVQLSAPQVAAKEHIDASRRTLTSMAELLAIVQVGLLLGLRLGAACCCPSKLCW